VLNEKQVENVKDFIDRAGKRTIEATLHLKKDEAKGVTRLFVDFGGASSQGFDGADEVIEKEGLWPCPVYEGSEIVMTNYRFVTKKLFAKEEKNGPQLPRIVCKREMKPEEVAGFFAEEGATSEFSDFISKRGRPFTGSLFRKPTGRHGFKFPERKPRPKKGDSAVAKGAAKKATMKAKTKAKSKTKPKTKPKTKAAAKKK
jgi:DNA topoisomerase-3